MRRRVSLPHTRLWAPVLAVVVVLAVVAASLAVRAGGSGGGGGRQRKAQARNASSTGSTSVVEAPCGAWISPGTALASSVKAAYGEIDDCASVGGAWIVTTDDGDSGPGRIGIDVCGSNCAHDMPAQLDSWTWYAPSDTGSERLAGLNKDGTILFIGGAGEIAFDTRTMSFSKEITHH